MNPTMKLRWVKRKIKVDPAFNVFNGHPTETVLQQWWEGFPENTIINYSHPDAYQLQKKPPGEWRDIPIEEEK